MDSKNLPSDALAATEMPLSTRVLSVIAVLVILGAISFPLFGIFFMPRLESVVTLQDFKTQTDCINYLNHHLPVPLPDGAVVSEFELVSWLDWTLDAAVKLPPGSGVEYVHSVQNLSITDPESVLGQPSTENYASYDIQGEASISGSVRCEEGSRFLSIHCGNFP